MKNKKGFVFIETIVMIVILAVSLLLVYNSYSNSINNEKKYLSYDDVAYIYRNYFIVDYLLNNSNIITLLSDTNSNLNKSPYYFLPIGTGTANLFSDSISKENFQLFYGGLDVGGIYIVSSKIKTDCDNCFSNIDNVQLRNYIKGMELNGATSSNVKYFVVVRYDEKADSSQGIASCIQNSAYCKSNFASLEISTDMIRELCP